MSGEALFFAAAGFAFGWFVVGPVVAEWVRAWRRRRWEREENRRRALAWRDYWPHIASMVTPGESVEPAAGDEIAGEGER